MAVKLSKGVTQRMRSCLCVLSALWEQGPGIAAQMLERVTPNLRDEDPRPDFYAQLVAYGRTLEAALDRLRAADRALYDLREEQGAVRETRNRRFRSLDRLIIGLRRSLLGFYKAPKLERLALAGPNPRNPLALSRQAELIAERLRRDNLEEALGEPLFDPPFDPRPYAGQLESLLSETLMELDTLQRRVDLALEEKRQAMADYDNVFLRAARHFEEMCRFVGEDDLAAKVRPCTTRPGRTVKDPVAAETSAATGTAEIEGRPPGEDPPGDTSRAETAAAPVVVGDDPPSDLPLQANTPRPPSREGAPPAPFRRKEGQEERAP